MTDTTFTYPSCRKAIKLTESLAAPLLDSTRQQYEERIAENVIEVAHRESVIQEQQTALANAKDALE